MTTLVAGAGYVGAALAEELVARGEPVFALRRTRAPMPVGVTGLFADLHAPGLVLPATIDRLAYTVGSDGGDEAAYRRAYPDGLRAVLDGLDRAGARLVRGVFTSSTSVFAQEDASVVDERSPALASGNPAILREAEALLHERLGARGVVLRLAGIYGPGRERLVRMVRDGEARCAHPAPIGNRIHRDDCAGALAHLLFLDAPAPLYVGVDEAPVELCDVYRWIAQQLGVSPPMASEVPDARGRGARKRLDGGLLRRSGYAFRYPTFREGYGELIRRA